VAEGIDEVVQDVVKHVGQTESRQSCPIPCPSASSAA
jgi:hypothetical protein